MLHSIARATVILPSLRQIKRYRDYLRVPPAQVEFGEAIKHRVAAQQLHARIYLKHGYVTDADLTADGRIHRHHDPYQEHARYFAVTRGKTAVASARLIEVPPDGHHEMLQTVNELSLRPEIQALLHRLPTDQIAEVSALVKAKGESTQVILLLYRTMWHYSLTHGHRVWVMSCDNVLLRRLTWLFGDTITDIGPSSFFRGHTVTPTMIDLNRSLERMLLRRHYVPWLRSLRRDVSRFFIVGLPAEVMTPAQRRLAQRLGWRPE